MLATIFSITSFFVVLCVLAAPFAFVIERLSIYKHRKQMEAYRVSR